jgi:DNA-binding winged helix-turn-helix (wHTH) protein
VLVMDYFDEAAAKLERAFFNYLFHLRNARPRGNLMYVFATRRPMGPLYEMHELLDDGCTIGPLSYRDALASIRRDEARLGHAFTPTQRDRLIACSGGHPGFLKNACELLAGGQIDTDLPGDEIARQLLRSEKVRHLCRELWNDLATAEQAVVLKAIAGAAVPGSVDANRVVYLERTGILIRREGAQFGPSLDVFCPLFGAFVQETHPASPGALRIKAVFPNQARIETPTSEEQVQLSPKLFALLAALADGRGRICTSDELIARVYGDEAAGVTNAALSQLVKRLRGKLNPCARKMSGDPTYACVETIRGVGYKLNG